jgi:hypothetical protein
MSVMFIVLLRQSNIPEKDVPFDIDAGLLTVTDPNPIDVEAYEYEDCYYAILCC